MLSFVGCTKSGYKEIAAEENIVEKRRNHTLFYRIITLSLGGISLLGIGFAIIHSSWQPSNPNRSRYVYADSPIPKEVYEPVNKVFDEDLRYVGDSLAVDRNWDLLVAGHDAVWIENPSLWGLPQGIVAPFEHTNTPEPKPQNFYVISLLHSLHCLNMIRFQYYQERNHKNASTDPDAPKWKVHVEHCFEYLRQSISCGGDLIIEGSSPIVVGKGVATSVTGWGVEHNCINFEKLREFQITQESRYNLTWQT